MSNSSAEPTATIIRISGPLVVAQPMTQASLYEVVRVGNEGLIGEVIRLEGDRAFIQVYEETAGLAPGEPVVCSGKSLSVELGPGLLESIYDGVQRPLKVLEDASGHFLARGVDASGLNHHKKWDFRPTVEVGQAVQAGDTLGTVQETTLILHRIMVPPTVPAGVVKSIQPGHYDVIEPVAVITDEKNKDHEIPLRHFWPIRVARPTKAKRVPSEPLVSGCRSIDMFFPLVKGGAGCIPGPFGSGKTVTQQTLAKYCDAQVIVYIGCGERGNEMTEVLTEFPHLLDPNTSEPLMKRTVMIANTSNMPVAAREASVYAGITIAEYYRDMGYSVALMADSTSRWAEAMREMSGRLEEMPGEEGYPAYLGSRIAEFYERAGAVDCQGSEERDGSLTVIGAVSPTGGDLSEPVSQNTLRVAKTYWGLDAKLAYQRHFPAINWLRSYSLYVPNLESVLKQRIAPDYWEVRGRALEILQEEARLQEIVRLVGADALSFREKLILLVAKSIREDYLYQDSFDKDDAFTPPPKQYQMLKTLLTLHDALLTVGERKANFDFALLEEWPILTKVARMKDLSAETDKEFSALRQEIEKAAAAL